MDIRYAQVPVAGILGKLIRNPGYGGKDVGLNGWCYIPVPAPTKPLFMEALCESIAREGVRNPVIVYATSVGDFISFGGSRFSAARSLGLTELPALVNDYVGRYADGEAVSPENIESYFTDVPELLEFTDAGIDTHYSLERNRRDHYDPKGMEWADGADFIAIEFDWIK